ncbi:hypothetical protein [Acinetobacter gerneri]|uniref:hypothetical protein n=1 Tax=Acinetobacter gerneri TaxID=202952 RepID=UPI003212C344
MKKYKIYLIILSLIFLTSCKKNTLYFTPETKGCLYSSETKKPLSHLIGHVGYSLTDDNTFATKLDINGCFIIAPKTKIYYYIKPNIRKYRGIEPTIYIYIENFQPKSIDYSEFIWKQVPDESRGYSHFKKINVGIIYLDPEKP